MTVSISINSLGRSIPVGLRAQTDEWEPSPRLSPTTTDLNPVKAVRLRWLRVPQPHLLTSPLENT